MENRKEFKKKYWLVLEFPFGKKKFELVFENLFKGDKNIGCHIKESDIIKIVDKETGAVQYFKNDNGNTRQRFIQFPPKCNTNKKRIKFLRDLAEVYEKNGYEIILEGTNNEVN